MNKYTGEVDLRLGEKTVTLQFDWTSWSRLETEVGIAEVDGIIRGRDPRALAHLIAIGLAKHHPEITAERVIAASPPLVPTIAALQQALNWAYWGPEGPPTTSPAVEPAGKTKGKNPPPGRPSPT